MTHADSTRRDARRRLSGNPTPGLLAVLVLSVAFQNEFTAGVYLTTLFQGGCILLAFALVTMHRGRSAAAAPHPALAGAVA